MVNLEVEISRPKTETKLRLNFQETFYQTITIINTGIALLLAFLILTNPGQHNRRGNRWLGAFTCFLFYLFFENVLDTFGVFDRAPHLEMIGQYFLLSLPVMLLMTVRYYVEPDRKWVGLDWLHFCLVGFYLLLSLPAYFVDAEGLKNLEDVPSSPVEWVVGIVFFLAFATQVLYYTYVNYCKLQDHSLRIRQFSADGQVQDLTWLRYFVIAFLFMFLVFASMEIPSVGWWEDYLEVGYSLGLLAFGYFAVGQPEVFPYSLVERKDYRELMAAEVEIDDQLPPDEQLTEDKERLLRHMKDHRPYLDNQLNLSTLAAQLDMPPRLLSQVINVGFAENFSSYVNRHRTAYAMALLEDSKLDHLNIYQIGLESGFHSRTVFYTHFKKMTGKNPSTYRRERRT